MNSAFFKKLINSEESKELDFKREHYKLIGGNPDDTSKYVKDIISFSNTIRDSSAFIIIGISEENGNKKLLGVSNKIDDNILQSKIKDKVFPRPHFIYTNFEFRQKTFGVIEIPVRRYKEPIMATVKMKGLEVGKVYCRQGSMNIEANAREIIEIYKWITNISVNIDNEEFTNKISNIISKISLNVEPLSAALAEGLKIGKSAKDVELLNFCKNEIEGFYGKKMDEHNLDYRKAKVFMSPMKITSAQSYGGSGINQLWDELKSMDNFFEISIIMNEGIHDIEETLNRFKTIGINSYITNNRTAKSLFKSNEFGNTPIYLYSGFDTHNTLYQSIRKKYIEMLLNRV